MNRPTFVLGSTGKLGKAWLRLEDSNDLKALGGAEQFDLAEREGLNGLCEAIREGKPGLLVHAAGMADVDGCEREPERAMRINAEPLREISEACKKAGAGLLFYSSDYVFDGVGPKAEEDKVGPLNVYGRSKVAAEAAIRESGCEHLVVRINVPLAPPADGASFYAFLLENLRAGKQVNIVTDQWNNPLDTDRIAHWSWGSWQKGTRGCLHLAGGTYATRFDIARIVAQSLGVDSALVKPIKTAGLGQKAPRPERGGLLIAKQSQLFGTAPDLPTILKSLSAGLT